MEASPSIRPEMEPQRRHPRIVFSPTQRPRLRLALGSHDVVNASLGGLRLLYPSLLPPKIGTRVSGTLEWPHGEPPLQVTGTVVDNGRGYFSIACDPGTIPLGYLPGAQPR
jgi:hypothetical protein